MAAYNSANLGRCTVVAMGHVYQLEVVSINFSSKIGGLRTVELRGIVDEDVQTDTTQVQAAIAKVTQDAKDRGERQIDVE